MYNWQSVYERLKPEISEAMAVYWINRHPPRFKKLFSVLYTSENYQKYRAGIHSERRNTFRKLLPNYHNLMYERVNEPMGLMMSALLSRHPWLKKCPSMLGRFAEQLLRDLLVFEHVSRRKEYKIQFDLKFIEVKVGYVRWAEFNQAYWDKKIHDFPLWHLTDFYVNHPDPNLPSIDKAFQNRESIKNYVFSRADVFRFLHGMQVEPFQKNDQWFIKAMPVHHSELSKLDKATKKHTKLLIINLRTEGNPLWVILKRIKSKSYKAYVPADIDLTQSIETLKEELDLEKLDVIPVDSHCIRKHIKIDDALVWQYELFARILPYCLLHKPLEPLESYRNRLSLHLFIDYVWSRLASQSTHNLLNIKSAFQLASPLSSERWYELILTPVSDRPLQRTELVSLRAETILGKIDQKDLYLEKTSLHPPLFEIQPNEALGEQAIVNLASNEQISSLSIRFQEDNLVSGLYLAIHHHLKRIEIHFSRNSASALSDVPVDIEDKIKESLLYISWKNPENGVSAADFPVLLQLYNYSARNRFLHRQSPVRKNLGWQNAGNLLLDFFLKRKQVVPHNETAEIIRKDMLWRDMFFDLEIPEKEENAWIISNFTAMGLLGLDALFQAITDRYLKQYDPVHEYPRLNLHLSLDLKGDGLNSPSKTTCHLAQLLSRAYSSHACCPIIESLQLILPRTLEFEFETALISLIDVANQAHRFDNRETRIIYLYSSEGTELQSLINRLLQLTARKDSPLTAMIQFSALNDDATNPLNPAYRNLQNRILFNQRVQNKQALAPNTQVFYAGVKGELIPEDEVFNRCYELAQDFTGEDYSILLMDQHHGIEQQVEQAVEVAHQLQATSKKKLILEQDDPLKIATYQSSKNQLVTRDSLKGESLVFFNKIAGSSFGGSYLINAISPEALAMIKSSIAQFSCGLVPEHLPFGFYLASFSETPDSYILCYDWRKAIDEELEWKNRNREHQSSFKLKLVKHSPVKVMDGDSRQFNQLSEEEDGQQILWEAFKPGIKDLSKARAIIIQWASDRLDFKYNQNFLQSIFKGMDSKQMQALGQIVYHYDSEGLLHFLKIAEAIYINFGDENLHSWLRAYLGQVENGAELLNKQDCDALGQMVQVLQNKSSSYIAVLFDLFDTHSKAHHLIPFAGLWSAFQRLIAYCDERKLKLNRWMMKAALQSQHDMIGSVWIDRLYYCLTSVEEKYFSREIQQKILDNLDLISLKADGLYYAIRYNGYFYWSARLELQDFHAQTGCGYHSSWAFPLSDSSLVTHFSRFLASSLKLDFKEFSYYEQEIFPSLQAIKPKAIVLRSLLISLALGLDSIYDFNPENILALVNELAEYERELEWINQHYDLNRNLEKESLAVHAGYWSLICQVLKSVEIPTRLSSKDARYLLNGLGKCCLYLDKNGSLADPQVLVNLASLYKIALARPEIISDIQRTPWIVLKDLENFEPFEISEVKAIGECQAQLLLQLMSIDYKKSRYLPSRPAIEQALGKINSQQSIDPIRLKSARIEIISQWIARGCEIGEQDSQFRLLTDREKYTLKYSLHNQLLPQYRDANIALIDNLLGHLATEKSLVNQMRELMLLLTELKRIDNKPYFNDLGIVLGELNTRLSNNPLKKISLQGLSLLLNILMQEKHDSLSHFPFSSFSAMLDHLKDTLFNIDLNKLASSFPLVLQTKLKLIVKARISNGIKPYMIRVLPSKGIGLWLEDILNFFEELDKLKISLEVQQQIATLMERALSEEGPNMQPLMKAMLRINPYKNQLWLSAMKELLVRAVDSKSLSPLIAMLPMQGKDTPLDAEVIALRSTQYDGIQVFAIKPILAKLSNENLLILARYCSKTPCPPASFLVEELPNKSLEDVFHYFETVYQARGLRHYSLTTWEAKEINRILAGIRFKTENYLSHNEQKKLLGHFYYLNHYAEEFMLASIRGNLLIKLIQEEALANKNENGEYKLHHQIQLLALLRELLLRQTGKWLNHSQMLDLILAANYSNHKQGYQLKTGSGKSLIILARACILALYGWEVDIYSTKESLSLRDFEAFTHVFTAVGIKCAHILPHDDENAYQMHTGETGAVNYVTPGSFSLYLSARAWSSGTQRRFDFSPANRAVILDEGDELLLDDTTIANFSDAGVKKNFLYNHDAWVYEIAYNYFIKIRESLPINAYGIPYLKRNEHLKTLCELIQAKACFAPVSSSFVETYLQPVLDAKFQDSLKKALDNRDAMLKKLMTASFTAASLKKDVDFCIEQVIRTLAPGVSFSGREAKVLINNQVQIGATFSELVHQLLHVRLNQEAVLQGEEPDYFIAPDAVITLSQNVASQLERYYGHMEAYSGTMGDEQDIAQYRKTYGLDSIVKFPGHEQSQREYLGMHFCEGDDDYYKTIASYLIEYQRQPGLVVVKDDVAVKEGYQRLQAHLPKAIRRQLVADTNDSGLDEKYILPFLTQPEQNVISARMSRGTDPKPEVFWGLLLIRGYTYISRFNKQGGGRTGRNGQMGLLVDVIDYAKVRKEFESLMNSEDSEELQAIMQKEWDHLREMLVKHKNIRQKVLDEAELGGFFELQDSWVKTKWDFLENDPVLQQKYIITRAVALMKYSLKRQQESSLRRKEALIAEASGHVLQALIQGIGQSLKASQLKELRQDFLKFRDLFEEYWQQRMLGLERDDEDVFNAFYAKISIAWDKLRETYPDLLAGTSIQPPKAYQTQLTTRKPLQALPLAGDMFKWTLFYQHLLKKVNPMVQARTGKKLRTTYYGDRSQGLSNYAALFLKLIALSQNDRVQDYELGLAIVKALMALPTQRLSLIPVKYLTSIIEDLLLVKHQQDLQKHLDFLSSLFTLDNLFSVNDPSVSHLKTLGRCARLIMRLGRLGLIDRQHPDYRRFDSNELLSHLSSNLWNIWDSISANAIKNYMQVFTANNAIAVLFTTRLSPLQWAYCLERLKAYSHKSKPDTDYLEEVVNYLTIGQFDLLNTYHEALFSLLTIAFHYPERRINFRGFPLIAWSQDLSPAENAQFYKFLSEQMIMNDSEINELTKLISSSFSNHDEALLVVTEVNDLVTHLPPNLPFSLILTRVKVYADSQNRDQFINSMRALKPLGKALNTWTKAKGITSLGNSLATNPDHLNTLSRLHNWIIGLEKESRLEQGIRIFELLSTTEYNFFDADNTLSILETFNADEESIFSLLLESNKSLEPKAYGELKRRFLAKEFDLQTLAELNILLKESLDILSIILQVRADQQFYLIADCLDAQTRGFTVVREFFSLMRFYKQNFEGNSIWSLWRAGKSLPKLEEVLKILQMAENISSKNLKACIREQALKEAANIKAIGTFIHLLESPYTTIPDNQLVSIFLKFINGHLTDSTHLIQSFKMQILVNRLEAETPDALELHEPGEPSLTELFEGFSKHRETRVQLLHAVYHRSVQISPELSNRCFSLFQGMMPAQHQIIQSKRLKVRFSFGPLAQIRFMAKEISRIVNLLPQQNPEDDSRVSDDFQNLVNRYEQKYMAQLGFQANGRRGIAKTFFADIRGYYEQQGFYSHSLSVILSTQRAIIERDKELNKSHIKGYSTLFNLTQNLALLICYVLLTKKDLDLSVKTVVWRFLEDQKTMLIQSVAGRGLKEELNEPIESLARAPENPSVELYSRCQKAVLDLTAVNSPRKIYYLLPFLQGHFAPEVELKEGHYSDGNHVPRV